jgi:hypothetical protein
MRDIIYRIRRILAANKGTTSTAISPYSSRYVSPLQRLVNKALGSKR